MAITKLKLQPITIESDYSNITIGNSKFTDDVWDLSPFISSKTISDTLKKVKFSYISNNEMKEVIKLYAYYKLSHVKPRTLPTLINGALPLFVKYCNEYKINSFNEITKAVQADREAQL